MASIPLHGMKVQSDSQGKLSPHNPKVVSSNLTPATMGAHETNPLSALLIYGYELSRN
jgi:hypothetical protein